MPPPPDAPSKPVLGLTSEPKARGANRSTKVAGKLKVLPDQPADAQTSPTPPGAPGPSSSAAPAATLAGAGAQLGRPSVAPQRSPVVPVPLAVPPPRGPPPPPRSRDFVLPPGHGSAEDSDDDDGDDEAGEAQEEEVYNQIALIPEGTARRDALRLTKSRAKSLPRVTAYATANAYRFGELMKFFNARRAAYHTDAKQLDDVIYTPYVYEPSSHAPAPSSAHAPASGAAPVPPAAGATGDLLGVPELRVEGRQMDDGAGGVEAANGNGSGARKKKSKFDATPTEAEIFIFKYGTVVIWGMTEPQEKRFLSSLKRFEVERLAAEDIEMEDLNYYYANYSRIYNDVITLRKGSSYMTKLSLSHALSQSVKISLFEELISNTIEETKDVPEEISETGKVNMSHKEIMCKIGELFLLRTNINSVGSVLDSPEVFWTYPDLQPLYDAARSYLEIPQRINLLNTRVEVLQDMLQLLKESVSSRHSERLEQIVIALIGLEIVLGIITILVDLFS